MTNSYQEITDSIIAMLSEGTVPWRKPWNSAGSAPTSLATGKAYRGINNMILGITAMMQEYSSPYWGTYKQIQGREAQVRKGEKSTQVILWKPFTKKEKDDAGNETEGTGFMLRTFRVFNADQCDWQGEKPGTPELVDHDPIATAEAIAKAYLANGGPSFSHGGDRAFYSPSQDAVRMPEMGTFHTPEGYYSTLFHELTHSTGHASRLKRDGVTEGHRFGDADYSREELIAEMGSAFLCNATGVAPDETLANSVAYIKSWMKALQDDPKMVIWASGRAQKASDLIMGIEAYGAKDEEEAA